MEQRLPTLRHLGTRAGYGDKFLDSKDVCEGLCGKPLRRRASRSGQLVIGLAMDGRQATGCQDHRQENRRKPGRTWSPSGGRNLTTVFVHARGGAFRMTPARAGLLSGLPTTFGFLGGDILARGPRPIHVARPHSLHVHRRAHIHVDRRGRCSCLGTRALPGRLAVRMCLAKPARQVAGGTEG